MKKTSDALELIKEVSEQKREQLMEAGKVAAEKVKTAANIVNESVHEKPWYYLGGAAVIGFLAGIFTRSKRQSNNP